LATREFIQNATEDDSPVGTVSSLMLIVLLSKVTDLKTGDLFHSSNTFDTGSSQ